MTTTKKNSAVPKLRFKGFDGEWEILKLKEVAKIARGKFTPRPRNSPIYYNGDIPFVQTSDVVNANGKIEVYTQTLNEKGLAVSKLFPAGAILITIAANIGHVGVLQIDMACPDSLIGIIPNAETNNYFLSYYLATHQKKMDYLAPEGAQKNINIDFLNPYKVPITSLPEQQKIASFLSAVDEKIQQLSKKKELLEQYKKGVMQQLFSGQLRFKDEKGKKFPDWEEKRLKDLVEKDRKIRYGIVQPGKYDPDGRFMIRGQDYSSVKGWADSTEFFKVSEGIELKYKKARVKTGDLLITIVGAGTGWLEVVPEFLEGANITQTTGRIAINKSIASPGYVKNYYFSYSGRKEINGYIKGQAQPGLNIGDVEIFKLPLPTLEEQQKIATYLSSIDTKIEALSNQVTQTQSFKKGLLQQMFV